MTENYESAAGTQPAAGNRIVLGTVQLGLPYGRRRHEDAPDVKLVTEILEEAWTRGIRVFDTADQYGKAAPRLSNWLVERGRIGEGRIVTKVPGEECDDEGRVERSCRRFAGAASVMVLTHGSVAAEKYSRFRSICQSHGVAAGQSVYTATEVAQAAFSGVLRVQVPVNALDIRQLVAARNSGIELDARSIYLQGVLLDDPDLAELRVPSIGGYVREVQERARDCGMSPAQALLSGVMTLVGPNDRVVVGVDSPDQLDVVSLALETPRDTVQEFLDAILDTRSRAEFESDLLDPRTWNP